MFSSAERYRRCAIEAQQQASQAIDKKVRDAFEEVASNWLGLAEQAEWLAAQVVAPRPGMQQQQHIQAKADGEQR